MPINVSLKKSVENSLEGYIVYIDYSKAFDNVSYLKLFLTMEEMGFPKHLIKLIEDLYTSQETFIRWNKNHTEPFDILRGVRHGFILSQHSFSLYT